MHRLRCYFLPQHFYPLLTLPESLPNLRPQPKLHQLPPYFLGHLWHLLLQFRQEYDPQQPDQPVLVLRPLPPLLRHLHSQLISCHWLRVRYLYWWVLSQQCDLLGGDLRGWDSNSSRVVRWRQRFDRRRMHQMRGGAVLQLLGVALCLCPLHGFRPSFRLGLGQHLNLQRTYPVLQNTTSPR